MSVHLHPALTAAAAEKVLREIGGRLVQDRRGNLRVFTQCQDCRSTLCAEMQFCARPTEPEAA